MRHFVRLGLGVAMAGLMALAPVAAFAQASAPSLSLMAQSGAFAGKWVYRSFSNSPDPKQSLAKVALGQAELTLTEVKGQVTGTRTGTTAGSTYDLAGVALYAPKQGATLRLHGTATVSGKFYNYDYFGYLMPAWSVGADRPIPLWALCFAAIPVTPAKTRSSRRLLPCARNKHLTLSGNA